MQIAKVAGIPIRIHFTFVLILIWLGWRELAGGGSFFTGILFAIGLFGCVLLHELGHALTAKRFGIGTADIVLYPMGGVSRLEKTGEPGQEFWITLAGPLVNIVIAILLWLGLTATGQSLAVSANDTGPDSLGLLPRLFYSNIALALFNLLPAFPMDGGRVLRSILAQRMNAARATSIAAKVGQAFAVLFGLWGLLSGNFILIFIAFFVFVAASGEATMKIEEEATSGRKVSDAMITRFETLTHGQTLGDAADMLLNTYQQDFPVVLGEKVLGVLPRDRLIHGLANFGREGYVSESMLREFPRAAPGDDLSSLYAEIQGNRSPILVFEDEKLVGLLTSENLGEYILIRQSLAAPHRQSR